MPEHSINFRAASIEDTGRLAIAIAGHVLPGTTLCLSGTLGAGKTKFAQLFATALGVPIEDVVSPTYIICQSYVTERFQLNHMDVYRIEDEDEFLALGADEMLAGDGVQLIEWAERVVSCLPDDRLEIEILVSGETTREFNLKSLGEQSHDLLAKVARELD